MKLLLENWREYLKEAHGIDTTWDNVHIDDVFKITGKSCEEGTRECKSFSPSDLESKLKHKPVRVGLEPESVRRIERAKEGLEHPLIVLVDSDTGEYQHIMDGNHRFAAATALAKEEEGIEVKIKVKELYTDEYNQLFGVSDETPT